MTMYRNKTIPSNGSIVSLSNDSSSEQLNTQFMIRSWINCTLDNQWHSKDKDVIIEVNGFLPSSNCKQSMDDRSIYSD